MALLTISAVGRQVGLRPSAIRYYERVGILPAPRRIGGQRRYDIAVVHQLAVLLRAREVGFTLDEIRRLFLGFARSTPVSERWNKLAQAKIAELDARIRQMRTMKDLLRKLQSDCHCDTVERCGARILQSHPNRD